MNLSEYIENIIDSDEYVKVASKNKKINSCIEYVKKKARKFAAGDCVCVDDETVKEWIKEFYLDVEETEVEVKTEEPIQPIQPKKEKEKKNKNIPGGQLSLWDF